MEAGGSVILSGSWADTQGGREMPPAGRVFRASVGAEGRLRDEARAVWSYLHAALARPLGLILLERSKDASPGWLGSFPDLAPTDHPCTRSTIGLPTSGTTGTPKRAVRDVRQAFDAKRTGDSEARWLLGYAPHRWAGVSVLLQAVRARAAVVVPASFDAADVVAAGRSGGATHVGMTPSHLRRILLSMDASELARLPLRQVTFGGEVATQSILDKAGALWPAARVTHVYATTELGDVCSVSDGRAGFPRRKFERAGFAVDPGGELLVDGRGTGDLWELGDDRYHFVGRREERVDVGGATVSLVGVEAAALAVDGVIEARAYARRSALLGHVVALDFAGDVGERELRRALRAGLPKYAQPASLRRVDAVALSDAHKVRREETA